MSGQRCAPPGLPRIADRDKPAITKTAPARVSGAPGWRAARPAHVDPKSLCANARVDLDLLLALVADRGPFGEEIRGLLAEVARAELVGRAAAAAALAFDWSDRGEAATCEAVAALLAAGASPDRPTGRLLLTPLMAAARALAEASDPLARGRDGKTALMLAADSGSLECLAGLSPVGDHKAVDHLGATALMRAAGAGHVECVRLLMALGDPGRRDNAGNTALAWAARGGDAAAIAALLGACDAREANADWQTPLMVAARCGRAEAAEALPAASDVDAASASSLTALMLAAMSGHAEVVEILLKKADPGRQGAKGCDALMIAVLAEQAECARLLLPRSRLENVDGCAGQPSTWRSERKLGYCGPVRGPRAVRAAARGGGGGRKRADAGISGLARKPGVVRLGCRRGWQCREKCGNSVQTGVSSYKSSANEKLRRLPSFLSIQCLRALRWES